MGKKRTKEERTKDGRRCVKRIENIKRKDKETGIRNIDIKGFSKKVITTTLKYEVADKWIKRTGMIRYVLELVGLARSTYYYYKKKENKTGYSNVKRGRKIPGYSETEDGIKISDEETVAIIRAYRRMEDSVESEYGYMKLKYFLSREYKMIINHKKVYRLCKEECLLKKRAPRVS